MDAPKRKGVRSNAKSHLSSQACSARAARRGVCRRVDCGNECRVVKVGATAASDCGTDHLPAVAVVSEEQRAKDRERLMRDAMRFAFRTYQTAWHANPHVAGQYDAAIHSARLTASALLNIAASMEEARDMEWDTLQPQENGK